MQTTAAALDPLAGPLGHAPLASPAAWAGALAIVGLALALGLLVLPRGGALQGAGAESPAGELPRRGLWLLRLTAGLYLTALLTLGFGQFTQLLGRLPMGWFGLAGWIAAVAVAYREHRNHLARPRRRRHTLPPGPLRLIWLVGCVLLGCWLVALLGAACTPPINYDVLEYHLGVIPHHFLTGRITPLPSVFYSAQPTATEVLYSLTAHIEGTPWGHAPGLLQWLMILTGTGLFLKAAQTLGVPKAARPWLALLLLLHPIVLTTHLDRLTDWTGAMLLAAGLLVYARAWGGLPGQGLRPSLPAGGAALLLGLFAGAAAGSKWTHMGTVTAPLLLLALATGWRHPMPGRRLLSALLCGLAASVTALMAWLPWGLWLLHERGNPFAPFLAARFPSPAWSGGQLDFLLKTHGHLSPLQAVYWQNLMGRLTLGLGGPPLIALAALALLGGGLALLLMRLTRRWGGLMPCARARVEAAAWILAGQAIGLLLWGQLLHGADRFLVPPLLASALVLGMLGLYPLARKPGIGMPQPMVAARAIPVPLAWLPLLLALTASGMWHGLQWARSEPDARAFVGWLSLRQGPLLLRELGAWPYAAGRTSRHAYLDRGLGATTDLFAAANRLPAGSRVLAINEARRYYFAGDVQVVCVFDRHPLRQALSEAGTPEALRAWLRSRGYTHLLVNDFEAARLLEIHPPLDVTESVPYRELLRQPPGPARMEALLRTFPGRAEFATEPLGPRELTLYQLFLAELRPQAVWSLRPSPTQPDMWIAPL